jgi:hypothetical protein
LAQSITALVHKEPHKARSHPTSIVKTEYNRVFNDSFSPFLFLRSASIMRIIESILRWDIEDFNDQEKTNLKFHIAVIFMARFIGRSDYKVDDIVSKVFNGVDLKKEILDATIVTILLARHFKGLKNQSLEVISKSKPFTDFLISKYSFVDLETVAKIKNSGKEAWEVKIEIEGYIRTASK